MSLPQIRDEYRVPARLGARVAIRIPGEGDYHGTITGCTDLGGIVVNFEGFPVPQVVHPRQVTYLKDPP